MRKVPTYIIATAMSLITLSGCVNADNDPVVSGRKDCPDFTATIGGVHTRAFDRSWESGDKIGITGVDCTNVCYLTKDGKGSFTVEKPGEQIYFQDESDVTFTAYYPWGDSAVIDADTKEQSKQKSFDFLWAKASGRKNSPNVNFIFSHKMSKVSFTIKRGNGMSYEEIKGARLMLTGLCHSGSFSITDGNTVVNGDDDTDEWMFTGGIAPVFYNDTEETITFSFIFFPQVFDKPIDFLAKLDLLNDNSYNLRAGIDFTSANREIDGTDAKNEWVAGRQYNLSLTLHKTDISVDMCVINPWNEVAGEDIIVD